MENTPLRIEKYLAPDLVAILMAWIEAKCAGWDGDTKGSEIAFMLSRWQQPERNTLLAWRVYRERGVASTLVCLAAGDDEIGVEVWNEREGWLADAA